MSPTLIYKSVICFLAALLTYGVVVDSKVGESPHCVFDEPL